MKTNNPGKVLLHALGWFTLQPMANLLVSGLAILYFRYFISGQSLNSDGALVELFQWIDGANHWLMIAMNGVILAAILLVARFREVPLVQYVDLDTPMGGPQMLTMSLVAGCACNIWLSIILNSGVIPPTLLDSYAQSYEALSGSMLAVELLAVVIFAPLAEELLFRGIILKRLRSVLPGGFSIIMQAMLFGLLHGNALWITYAALIGAVMGYIRVHNGSLRATVVFHMSFNASAYLFEALSGPIWSSGPAFMAALVASGGIFLLALSVLCKPSGNQVDRLV